MGLGRIAKPLRQTVKKISYGSKVVVGGGRFALPKPPKRHSVYRTAYLSTSLCQRSPLESTKRLREVELNHRSLRRGTLLTIVPICPHRSVVANVPFSSRIPQRSLSRCECCPCRRLTVQRYGKTSAPQRTLTLLNTHSYQLDLVSLCAIGLYLDVKAVH